MQFPTILQYVESLTNNDGLFKSLGEVKCVMGSDGQPQFRIGNFGAVFRVKVDGRDMALKLFMRWQANREANYEAVSDFLRNVECDENYMLEYNFLKDELYVFNQENGGTGCYFSLLLMEWVEGELFSTHLDRAALDRNTSRLEELSEKFDNLALWLLNQQFAHGDIKPDNIVVRECDDSLALIDYDAMYVPSMMGQIATEIGTPAFQHPMRGKFPLTKNVDDYSIAIISFSLKVLTRRADLWARYHDGENIILTPLQIGDSTSECYSLIADELSDLAESPLYSMLQCMNPKLDGLYEVLSIDNMLRYGALADTPSLGNQKDLGTKNEQYDAMNGVIELKAYRSDGRWGFADQYGHQVIAPVFEAALDFSGGYAAVKVGGLWGFVNCRGVFVVPPIYRVVGSFSEGFAAVLLVDKYGYIDTLGRLVARYRYDDAWHIHCSLGLVRRGGLYGYVSSRDWRMKIAAKFEFAQSFSEGYAMACSAGKYGYINTVGRWVVPPIYDYAMSCHDGVAKVEKDGVSKVISLPLPLSNYTVD